MRQEFGPTCWGGGILRLICGTIRAHPHARRDGGKFALCHYSRRKATSGSTRAARRAGKKAAASPVTTSRAPTPA